MYHEEILNYNKKMDFTGVGQVYRFTLRQLAKNKANCIIFAGLLFAAFVMIPIMSFLVGDGQTASQTFTLQTGVSTVSDYLSGSRARFDARYGIQMAYSILTMIICVFSATFIVRAIVEEKSSKLVETLMVSIRPLALVFGKILAVMTYMFAFIALLLCAFCLSYVLSDQFLDVSFVGNMLSSLGITTDVLNIGISTVFVVLISLLLAYFLFSLIAGLAGAGCSDMDEVEGANMAAMGAILAGYLISCFTLGMGDSFSSFFAVCPVISAFSAPVYYIFGAIGFKTLLFSWIVQILTIGAVLLLTAQVYDQLIMYRGNRLKMSRIVKMAFGKENGGKKKGKRERK